MPALHGTSSLIWSYGLVLASTVGAVVVRRGRVGAYLRTPVMSVIGLLAAAIAGGVLLYILEHGAGHPLSLWVRVPVMVIIMIAAGVAGGYWLARRGGGAVTLKRGTAVISGGDAARRRGIGEHGLMFAGVTLDPLDETKHFKLLGTTGTGKSTAIRELLQAALARGDRAVFADPDVGYLAKFYDPARGDVILNPFEPRSARWDLYQELRSPYDYDQMARSLIGEGTGAERTWKGYAQTFCSSLLRQTHEVGVCDMQEFYRLLTSAPVSELRELLEGTPAQSFLEPDNERMFGSVRAVATASTTALDYIRVQKGDGFSIRRWLEEGIGVLFLPYRADQVAALRSIISTWMRIAIFQTLSQDEKDHRIWFVVDELDALGAIDGLKDALARLRKFGGRCVLGFQSIAQVSGLYGEQEAQTIVENCGNTLILRCSASERGGTAEFASRLIGQREVIRPKVMQTRSRNVLDWQRGSTSRTVEYVVEHAVMASEIEQLADLAGYLKIASQPTWNKVKLGRG